MATCNGFRRVRRASERPGDPAQSGRNIHHLCKLRAAPLADGQPLRALSQARGRSRKGCISGSLVCPRSELPPPSPSMMPFLSLAQPVKGKGSNALACGLGALAERPFPQGHCETDSRDCRKLRQVLKRAWLKWQTACPYSVTLSRKQ